MNKIKEKLINEAIKKYNRIYPCGNKSCLDSCFTKEGNSLYFWFNTEDASTHILYEKLN